MYLWSDDGDDDDDGDGDSDDDDDDGGCSCVRVQACKRCSTVTALIDRTCKVDSSHAQVVSALVLTRTVARARYCTSSLSINIYTHLPINQSIYASINLPIFLYYSPPLSPLISGPKPAIDTISYVKTNSALRLTIGVRAVLALPLSPAASAMPARRAPRKIVPPQIAGLVASWRSSGVVEMNMKIISKRYFHFHLLLLRFSFWNARKWELYKHQPRRQVNAPCIHMNEHTNPSNWTHTDQFYPFLIRTLPCDVRPCTTGKMLPAYPGVNTEKGSSTRRQEYWA